MPAYELTDDDIAIQLDKLDGPKPEGERIVDESSGEVNYHDLLVKSIEEANRKAAAEGMVDPEEVAKLLEQFGEVIAHLYAYSQIAYDRAKSIHDNTTAVMEKAKTRIAEFKERHKWLQ